MREILSGRKATKKQYLSSTTKIVVLWFENLCECTAQWLRLRITVFFPYICMCSGGCVYVFLSVHLVHVCGAQYGKSLVYPDCLCCNCSDMYRYGMCLCVCMFVIRFQHISGMNYNISCVCVCVVFPTLTKFSCAFLASIFFSFKKCLMAP